MIYYSLLFIVPTPDLLPYHPFDGFYTGMALIYECVFEVDIHDDPDAKPVTVWKKNDTEITSNDRLNVISPMKQDGSETSNIFRAKLEFKYLIADQDKGNYTCESFVNSSADSKFIKKGNSSRMPFSLSVKGTLSTIMQNTLSTCMYMYIYMKQILMSTNVKSLRLYIKVK